MSNEYVMDNGSRIIFGAGIVEPQTICFSKPFELEGDLKMTDFKVGDVVCVTSNSLEMAGLKGVITEWCRPYFSINFFGYGNRWGYEPSDLELVSRAPSDSLKAGDSGPGWRVEPTSKPALKVGDRVRVLDPQCGERTIGEIRYIAGGNTAEITLAPIPRHRSPLCWKGSLDQVELLPPEQAKLGAEELLNAEVNRVIGPFMRAMAERLPDELNAAELNMARERALGQEHKFQVQPPTPKPARLTPSLHESGAGIAKLNLKAPTKHRDRLMTTSWAPYGDWDNLPDAD